MPGAPLVATNRSARVLVVIVTFKAQDVPPPGAGLKTVTAPSPTAAMSAAGIAALSCVGETNVVTRSTPFQRAFEPLTKFAPLITSVKSGSPATTVCGFKPETVGVGFVPSCVMVKVWQIGR